MVQRILLSIFLSTIICISAWSQVDNVLWSSLRLRINTGEKQSMDIRPIVRFNQDISSYQNTSIDIAYRYTLSRSWTVGAISRTWFLDEGRKRQFIWPAIIYKNNFENLTFQNRFMYHYAFDIDDVFDADFIRIKPAFSKNISDIHKVELAVEPWYQLNGIKEIQRIRYELSMSSKISNTLGASIMYRRENFRNDGPQFNMYVTTLTFNI